MIGTKPCELKMNNVVIAPGEPPIQGVIEEVYTGVWKKTKSGSIFIWVLGGWRVDVDKLTALHAWLVGLRCFWYYPTVSGPRVMIYSWSSSETVVYITRNDVIINLSPSTLSSI